MFVYVKQVISLSYSKQYRGREEEEEEAP